MDLERLRRAPAGRLAMVGRAFGPRWSEERSREAIRLSRAARGRDPRAILEWALVAVALAESSRLRRAWARAQLELGNALRLVDRLPEAAAVLRRAARLVDADASSAQRLDLLSYRASLALDRGDWPKTIRHAAAGVEAASGERRLSFAIHLANGHRMGGRVREAAAIYWRIMQGAEELDHRRLALGAVHSLTLSLVEAGESDAALRALEDSRPLYRLLGTPRERLSLEWIEAMLLHPQDRQPGAIEALLGVRARLLDLEQPVDGMAAGVDALYLLAWAGCRADYDGLLDELLATPVEHVPGAAVAALRRLRGRPPAAVCRAVPEVLRQLGSSTAVIGATRPVVGSRRPLTAEGRQPLQ